MFVIKHIATVEPLQLIAQPHLDNFRAHGFPWQCIVAKYDEFAVTDEADALASVSKASALYVHDVPDTVARGCARTGSLRHNRDGTTPNRPEMRSTDMCIYAG